MLERTRPHRDGRAQASPLLAAAAILAPATAQASEGGLVILPDVFGLLPIMVVLFAALVIPVDRLVLKPILRVLDEREARIAGTRSRAEALERDADAVLARYESSVQAVREEAEQSRRATLEAARGDAAGTTGEARGEAEAEIDRARGEIAQALEGARATLRAEAQELARQAASTVLGRSL